MAAYLEQRPQTSLDQWDARGSRAANTSAQRPDVTRASCADGGRQWLGRPGLAVRAKTLLRKVLLMLLTFAVLAALLWYGDASQVITLAGHFQPIYLLWFIVMMLAHEVVRGVLWWYLIGTLRRGVPLRAQVFAFAAGEAAKILPTGAYVQNYLLQRATGTDFGRSSAATTVMILGEALVGLAGVVVLGVGAWSAQLRLGIIAGGLAVALLARAVVAAAPRHAPRTRWSTWGGTVWCKMLEGFKRFRAGVAILMQPQIAAVILLLCTLYVVLDGAGLYIIVRALGIGGITFWQALAVRCFGLAFYIILGSLEAASVGAFIGLGLGKSAAVSVILVNRVLSIAVISLAAVLVLAFLHDEWRSVRAPRHASPQQ